MDQVMKVVLNAS